MKNTPSGKKYLRRIFLKVKQRVIKFYQYTEKIFNINSTCYVTVEFQISTEFRKDFHFLKVAKPDQHTTAHWQIYWTMIFCLKWRNTGQNVDHLFNCPAEPTTVLESESLQTNPVEGTEFLGLDQKCTCRPRNF